MKAQPLKTCLVWHEKWHCLMQWYLLTILGTLCKTKGNNHSKVNHVQISDAHCKTLIKTLKFVFSTLNLVSVVNWSLGMVKQNKFSTYLIITSTIIRWNKAAKTTIKAAQNKNFFIWFVGNLHGVLISFSLSLEGEYYF